MTATRSIHTWPRTGREPTVAETTTVEEETQFEEDLLDATIPTLVMNDEEEEADGVSYLGGNVVINVTTDETDLYTGQTAQTWVSISNPTSEEVSDGSKIRIYMKFEDAELPEGAVGTSTSGQPSKAVGSFQVDASNKDGQTSYYNCTLSKDAETGVYCFEFDRPINGDTLSIHLDSIFKNAVSAGGTNTIWTEMIDADGNSIAPDAENEQEKIDGNSQVVTWKTKADDFILKKTSAKTAKLTSTYDAEADTTTTYLTGAKYTISLTRNTEDTLEGMGKDYMYTVDFTDTLTLPEGVELTDEVKECIDNGTYTGHNPVGRMVLRCGRHRDQ